MAEDYVHACFAEKLEGGGFEVFRERFGAEEFVAGLDEGYTQLRIDDFELGGHFNSDGAATNDDYALVGVLYEFDVVAGLLNVFLLSQALWDCWPWSPKSCGCDDIVIGMI